MGYNAGAGNTTGIHNTFLGNEVGFTLTGGTGNTFIGSRAGFNATTATNNILIGYQAGNSITTGSSNVVIGNSGDTSVNITGAICLGNNVTGNTSNEFTIADNITQIRMTGLGTQAGGTTLTFDTTNKTIKYDSSSLRYKTNVDYIESEYKINDIIKHLRPVVFDWKDTGKRDFGLIAEEVESVLPEIVCYNERNTPEAVAYHKLTTVLLSHIQMLTTRIEDLEKKTINIL